MKLLAAPLDGLTETPVMLIVGTSAVTLVPKGTVRAMVCAASLMTPTTGGARPWKLKAVIALADSRPWSP